MSWLSPELIGGAVVTLVLIVGSHWVRSAFEKPRVVESPPDTVRKDRVILKRDTVTETVAETVIRYDTVRTTDTMHVPVPSGYRYMGTIETQPLDLSTEEATLTYFRGGRYIQKKYSIPQPTWGVGMRGTVMAGQAWSAATTTIGVSHMTEWGPMDVVPRVGIGYGAVLGEEYRAGPIMRVGVELQYTW